MSINRFFHILSSSFTHKSSFLLLGAGLLLYIAFFLSVFQLNSFVDEHEQPVAGWFISEGLMPYRDFFSHHAPLPLVIGSLPFLLPTDVDPILFLRLFVLVFHLLCWSVMWHFSNEKYRNISLLLIIFTGLSLPLFHLQMVLANGFVTVPMLAFGVLFLQHLETGRPKPIKMILLLAVTTFFAFWSTVASLFPLLLFAIILFVRWMIKKDLPTLPKLIRYGGVGLALQLIFPIVFLLFGTFQKFFWQVFTFNTQYYFPLRLAANEAEMNGGVIYRLLARFFSTLVNESVSFLQQSIVLLQALIGTRILLIQQEWAEIPSYLSLIWEVYVNSIASVNSTIMISLLVIGLCLLWFRRWLLASVFILITVSFFFRDNEIFHLSPAYLWMIVGASYLYVEGWARKNILVGVSGVCILLFLSIPITRSYQQILTERPSYLPANQVKRAVEIQRLTTADQSILILDGQILDYYLSRRLPASHQYFYHPWFHAVPAIRAAQLQNVTQGNPAAIVVSDELREYAPELMMEIEHYYATSSANSVLFVRRKSQP